MEHVKKPYTPPTLVVYGRMEELTRGFWGGSFDAMLGRAIGIGPVGGGWGPIEDLFNRSK